MAKSFEIILIACLLIALTYAEPPRQRVRFPGPAKITKLPAILANQELAPAPYPPAGLQPDPPFELPTEQIYGPPDQTYGPPDQTYGPPDQKYGPPDQTYKPQNQIYWQPQQAHDIPDDNNALPESASIIDSRDFFPQTEFTLPYAQRLIVFRPSRRPAPIRRPANSLLPANIYPQTQLTLPHPQRLTTFRPIRRPTAFRNPNSKPAQFSRPQPPKPVKISVGSRPQQIFAQLPPIIRNPIRTGNRIIAYSDRLQSW
ncbi:pollen-specific leucine-rich repeat extensin-like protein 4 [Teleopsis dalmanni]|uniref:pollen-specific leucine-rich repeat extensin-like protein 4 n=1 Tax=Teleopsis dalmanni TaxID=139649 RepID=UPI0018CFC111|nr:pollen-specific leucine-rich repeat extensin-like protein 4 [Teleopsis dalmanni]